MSRILLATLVVLGAPLGRGAGTAAGAQHWAWPVDGPVTQRFAVGPDPFARGQHRGIDIGATAGATVRSACSGTVSFAGVAGANGPTASVRCGALTATYTHLGAVSVRGGEPAPAGRTIGRAGAQDVHLGARLVGRRWSYVDPLSLLGEPRRIAPPLGAAPRARPAPPPMVEPMRPVVRRPAAVRRAVRPAPLGWRPVLRPELVSHRSVPWPVWAGLALLAAAVPGGWTLRRRRAGVQAAARTAAAGGR